MAHLQLFRKKLYTKKGTKVAIIFICPFGTKLWLVSPIMKRLQRAGYAVQAYDTTNDAFYAANPEILVELVATITEDIGKTIETLKQDGIEEFGVFGSSLGAFLAYNAISRFPQQLRWGVLNTGGDIAEAMWRLKKARRKHQKKGITQEMLASAWQQIGYPPFRDLRGNSYVIFSSPADNITPFDELYKCTDPMQKAGAHIEVISVRAIGHSSTVARGLKRSVELSQKARQGLK